MRLNLNDQKNLRLKLYDPFAYVCDAEIYVPNVILQETVDLRFNDKNKMFIVQSALQEVLLSVDTFRSILDGS